MSRIIRKAPEIKINALKALCELENYDKLIEDLRMVVKNDKSEYPIYCLSNMINGKNFLGHKNLKRFIDDHKEEIEIIKKYNCEGFLMFSKANGNVCDNSSTKFFNYIKQNKDKIDNIRKLINKMCELGIEDVTLYPEYKFDEEIHKVYTFNYRGLIPEDVIYLENIRIIHNYENDAIKYKTDGSNYYLPLKCIFSKKEVSKPYNFSIEVSNLIFDPSLLPDKIDYENTIGKIVTLSEGLKKDKRILRNCVDMNVGIEDLIESFKETLKKCELDCDEDSKKQLKTKLCIIKEAIESLQITGQNIEDSLITSSDTLTHENIDEEKKLYLKRRYESKIDWD